MKGSLFVEALKKRFNVTTDSDIAGRLGLTQPAIINWKKQKSITPRILAAQIHRLTKRSVSGTDVVNALNSKLGTDTLEGLAKHFGMTLQAVQYWKKQSIFTAKQTAKLVVAARKASTKHANDSALRPLVEFFPITKTESKQGAKFELFKVKLSDGKNHPYLKGLREELETQHGVYVFFDSRGQAIYAGKARKQSLWKEMTNAFNRKRGDIQRIRRVRHPLSKVQYQSSGEKIRQIRQWPVPIHDLAVYFSAYQVTDGMIGKLEALLVRSFANDLLNIRMETFGHTKKTKTTKKKAKKKK